MNIQEGDPDVELNKALDEWTRESSGRPLVIVTVGKSGAGKSTLINNFLELERDEMCITGDGASTTTRHITMIQKVKQNVIVQVVDTPGLGGVDEIRTVNVFKDLSNLTNQKADILLYCVSIHSSACIDSTDVAIIRAITSAFGPRIWLHTILALTFADVTSHSKSTTDYKARICNHVKIFQKALHRANVHNMSVHPVFSKEMQLGSIPAIPVGCSPSELPLGSNWTNQLFMEALKRSNPKRSIPLLEINKPSHIVQLAEFGGSVLAGTAVGAAVGTAIGAPFMGIGIIIGSAVGAVVGGTIGSVLPTVIKTFHTRYKNE